MLPARLVARCPSAQVFGRAAAPGWRVEFWKHGRDGSGKATLIEDTATQVPGVLYRIEDGDLAALDRAEGAGFGYDRLDDLAIDAAGTTLRVTSYVASHPEPDLLPFDWYLALVVAGAEQAGLGADHIAALRRHDWQVDAFLARAGRQEGLRALTAHGWADAAAVLRGQAG